MRFACKSPRCDIAKGVLFYQRVVLDLFLPDLICVILVYLSSFRPRFLNLHLIPACKLIFHILTVFKRNRCLVEKELCRVVGLICSGDEGVLPSCDTARVAGKTPRGAALQSNLPSGLLYETHVCEAGLHVCTTQE